jgi:hypothetical protein
MTTDARSSTDAPGTQITTLCLVAQVGGPLLSFSL